MCRQADKLVIRSEDHETVKCLVWCVCSLEALETRSKSAVVVGIWPAIAMPAATKSAPVPKAIDAAVGRAQSLFVAMQNSVFVVCSPQMRAVGL